MHLFLPTAAISVSMWDSCILLIKTEIVHQKMNKKTQRGCLLVASTYVVTTTNEHFCVYARVVFCNLQMLRYFSPLCSTSVQLINRMWATNTEVTPRSDPSLFRQGSEPLKHLSQTSLMMKMRTMMWEESVRGQCPRSVSRTLFLADSVGTSKVTHTKLKLCIPRRAENATKTRNKHWMCT